METHKLATFKGYPYQTFFDMKKKMCGIVTDGSINVGDEIMPFYKLPDGAQALVVEIIESRKAAGIFDEDQRPNFFKVKFNVVAPAA